VLGPEENGGTPRRRLSRPVSRCTSFRAVPAAAANGIQISHTDSDGQGPAAMFSRGFLLGHAMFDRQVTALAPQYRVITWDQRGHGGTRATGAFTYWDSAADLLALLGHLGGERAALADMSQRGFLSLRAALTGPDRELVVIDSEVGLGDPAVAAGMSRCPPGRGEPGHPQVPGRAGRRVRAAGERRGHSDWGTARAQRLGNGAGTATGERRGHSGWRTARAQRLGNGAGTAAGERRGHRGWGTAVRGQAGLIRDPVP
jgi:pimeloyl-ACP methyl ester carboxylesterase